MNLIDAVYIYFVEILHHGAQAWNHIHHPDWETSTSYADTVAYARTVLADHPDSRVRIVETLDGHPDHHIEVD